MVMIRCIEILTGLPKFVGVTAICVTDKVTCPWTSSVSSVIAKLNPKPLKWVVVKIMVPFWVP